MYNGSGAEDILAKYGFWDVAGKTADGGVDSILSKYGFDAADAQGDAVPAQKKEGRALGFFERHGLESQAQTGVDVDDLYGTEGVGGALGGTAKLLNSVAPFAGTAGRAIAGARQKSLDKEMATGETGLFTSTESLAKEWDATEGKKYDLYQRALKGEKDVDYSPIYAKIRDGKGRLVTELDENGNPYLDDKYAASKEDARKQFVKELATEQTAQTAEAKANAAEDLANNTAAWYMGLAHGATASLGFAGEFYLGGALAKGAMGTKALAATKLGKAFQAAENGAELGWKASAAKTAAEIAAPTMANAVARYEELTANDYGINANGDLVLNAEGDGMIRGAAKALGGAAFENATEVALGKGVNLLVKNGIGGAFKGIYHRCPKVAKLFDGTMAKIGDARIDGAKKLWADAVKAYAKVQNAAHFEIMPVGEFAEEYMQGWGDEVLGFGNRATEKDASLGDFTKNFFDWDAGGKDLFFGIMGQSIALGGGAYATMRGKRLVDSVNGRVIGTLKQQGYKASDIARMSAATRIARASMEDPRIAQELGYDMVDLARMGGVREKEIEEFADNIKKMNEDGFKSLPADEQQKVKDSVNQFAEVVYGASYAFSDGMENAEELLSHLGKSMQKAVRLTEERQGLGNYKDNRTSKVEDFTSRIDWTGTMDEAGNLNWQTDESGRDYLESRQLDEDGNGVRIYREGDHFRVVHPQSAVTQGHRVADLKEAHDWAATMDKFAQKKNRDREVMTDYIRFNARRLVPTRTDKKTGEKYGAPVMIANNAQDALDKFDWLSKKDVAKLQTAMANGNEGGGYKTADGTVIMFLDNLKDANDALLTLSHEIGGHLAAKEGAKAKGLSLVDTVAEVFNGSSRKDTAAYKNERRIGLAEGETNEDATNIAKEEALVYGNERRMPYATPLQRAKTAVKLWLKERWMGAKLTDADFDAIAAAGLQRIRLTRTGDTGTQTVDGEGLTPTPTAQGAELQGKFDNAKWISEYRQQKDALDAARAATDAAEAAKRHAYEAAKEQAKLDGMIADEEERQRILAEQEQMRKDAEHATKYGREMVADVLNGWYGKKGISAEQVNRIVEGATADEVREILDYIELEMDGKASDGTVLEVAKRINAAIVKRTVSEKQAAQRKAFAERTAQEKKARIAAENKLITKFVNEVQMNPHSALAFWMQNGHRLFAYPQYRRVANKGKRAGFRFEFVGADNSIDALNNFFNGVHGSKKGEERERLVRLVFGENATPGDDNGDISMENWIKFKNRGAETAGANVDVGMTNDEIVSDADFGRAENLLNRFIGEYAAYEEWKAGDQLTAEERRIKDAIDEENARIDTENAAIAEAEAAWGDAIAMTADGKPVKSVDELKPTDGVPIGGEHLRVVEKDGDMVKLDADDGFGTTWTARFNKEKGEWDVETQDAADESGQDRDRTEDRGDAERNGSEGRKGGDAGAVGREDGRNGASAEASSADTEGALKLFRGDRVIAKRNGFSLVKNDENGGYWLYNSKGEGEEIGHDNGETQKDASMVEEFNRLVDTAQPLTLDGGTAKEIAAEQKRIADRKEIERRQNAPLKGGVGEVGQSLMDLGGAEGEDLFNRTAANVSADRANGVWRRGYEKNVKSAGRYEGELKRIAHGMKVGDMRSLVAGAELMNPLVPPNAVLVPLPNHEGSPIRTMLLGYCISGLRDDVDVVPALMAEPHEGSYHDKKIGKRPNVTMMRDESVAIPEGRPVVVIDNVIASGATWEAARKVLPNAELVTLADATRKAKEKRGVVPKAVRTEERFTAYGEYAPTSRWRRASKEESARLNNEPTIKVYRAMQVIDGKLYPPMAAKVDGKLVDDAKLGEWLIADERPDLAKNGKFTLNKGNGSSIAAAYNPYWHTSRSPLNDQFSSAYKRPNLVTVEVEVPVSELSSGYKADHAKDAVGEMSWHSGPVSSKLAKIGMERKVILSRYCKPIRVVDDVEVADTIAKMLKGKDISIPKNVITPSLRAELEQRGVNVEGGSQGRWRRSAVTPAEDAAYMDAVKRGDMETAQRMVREAAAKAMPNGRLMYHGSIGGGKISVFDTPTWFSANRKFASEYADEGHGGKLYSAIVGFRNPFDIGNAWDYLIKDGKPTDRAVSIANKLGISQDELASYADMDYGETDGDAKVFTLNRSSRFADLLKSKGYDAIRDMENDDEEAFAALSPSQIKSADPVTYDDDGNVIPLSYRFNAEKGDIRWRRIGTKGASRSQNRKEYGDKLLSAMKMLRDGEDREKVWRETGWWRGRDGKWRLDVNDDSFAFEIEKYHRLNVAPYRRSYFTIGEILDDENFGESNKRSLRELVSEYPEVEYIRIETPEYTAMNGVAEYEPKDDVIRISPEGMNNMPLRIVHEMQHAIQWKEGFKYGKVGYQPPSSFDSDDVRKRKMKDYLSNLGEMEAYIAEIRYGMDDEYRKNTPPWEDEANYISSVNRKTGVGLKESDIRFRRRTYTPNLAAQLLAEKRILSTTDALRELKAAKDGNAALVAAEKLARELAAQGSIDPVLRDLVKATKEGTPVQIAKGNLAALASSQAFSRWREILQDAQISLKEMETKYGIKTDASAYAQFDRNYGLVKDAMDKFYREIYEPLTKELKDNGVKVDDFDEYLRAKHGPERNRMIAERSPYVLTALSDARTRRIVRKILVGARDLDDHAIMDISKKLGWVDKAGNRTQESKDFEDDLRGSGATTAHWNNVLAKFAADGLTPKMLGAEKMVRELTKRNRDLLVQTGRLSADQAALWEKLSPNYVPLKSDMEMDSNIWTKFLLGGGADKGGSGGKRYSDREYNHAYGRGTIADSPLSFAIQQYEESLNRAYDNVARQKLAAMVRANPNMGKVFRYLSETERADLATRIAILKNTAKTRLLTSAELDALKKMQDKLAEANNADKSIPTTKILGANGVMHEVPTLASIEGTKKSPTAVIAFKENGELKFIRLGGFAQDDVNKDPQKLDDVTARRIATAVKKQNMAELGEVGKKIRWLTGMFSALRTAYSPTFLISNLGADNTQAMRNIYATFGGKGAVQFEKYAFHAFKAAAAALSGNYGTTKIMQYAKEWAENGGKIGGLATEQIGDIQKKMARDIRRLYSQADQLANINSVKDFVAWANDKRHGFADFVEKMNGIVEMSTRIAAYATARDMGQSINDAIAYSRDITVNFNRKGTATPWINALYAFSNATMQDIHRSLIAFGEGRTGKGLGILAGRGAKMGFGLMVLGFLSSMLGFWQDDQEDEQEGKAQYKNAKEWQKQNVMGIRIGGKTIGVPIRGLSRIPYYLGHQVYEAMTGRKSVGKMAADTALLAVENATDFLGQASTPLNVLTPSVLRPAVDIGINKTFTEQQMYREPMSNTDVRSEMGRGTTSGAAKWIARALNKMTGGNEGKRGLVDVQPEKVAEVWNWIFGSAGKDIANIAGTAKDIATGDILDRPLKNIPYLSRFIRNIDENSARYYEARDAYDAARKEYKTLIALDRTDDAQNVLDENPWLSERGANKRWGTDLNEVKNFVSKLLDLEKGAEGEDYDTIHAMRLKAQYQFMRRMERATSEDREGASAERELKRKAMPYLRASKRAKKDADRETTRTKRSLIPRATR